MIKRDLYIDLYDWHLRVFYGASREDTGEVIEELESIRCPRGYLERASRNMSSRKLNTGLTYSNKELRESVMIIGKWTSPAEFDNSFSHELRHFTDHVAKAFGMEIGGEEVAYLSGEIRRELFWTNIVFMNPCPCKDKNLKNINYEF